MGLTVLRPGRIYLVNGCDCRCTRRGPTAVQSCVLLKWVLSPDACRTFSQGLVNFHFTQDSNGYFEVRARFQGGEETAPALREFLYARPCRM